MVLPKAVSIADIDFLLTYDVMLSLFYIDLTIACKLEF